MTDLRNEMSGFALPLIFMLAWPGVTPSSVRNQPGYGTTGMNVSEQSRATSEEEKRVPQGTWGGSHIRVKVTESGASIQYDCAHGSIDAPLVLDRRGNFDLTGIHKKEHPGAIRVGLTPGPRPARYTGHVRGQVMTLTVTLTDTQEVVGTYTLTQGKQTRIVKCR